MQISVVRPFDLTPRHMAVWRRLQAEDDRLASPLLSGEFTQAVAEVRGDVEVGVMQEQGECVGFFPYHRRGSIGKPVGMRLSDVQAVVVGRHIEWSALNLIRGCGLKLWEFDHLITSQKPFESFQWGVAASPYMDLSGGFEVYHAERRSAGSRQIRQILRKARRIEREIGPLRFEAHSKDHQAFRAVLAWKSQQRTSTRTFDILRLDWVTDLLDCIWRMKTDGCTGMLSTLYAGDQLIAVHLGMRSGGVLHTWFPAYDREFADYSPGMILFVEMAKAASALGIKRIDLGKGPERHKQSLMSGCFHVAQGAVDGRRVNRLLARGMYQLRRRVGSSPLGPMTCTPKRMIHHWMAAWQMS